MFRLALSSAVLMTSACATQLDTGSVVLTGDELQVNLVSEQEGVCPTLAAETTVRVNGVAKTFSDRGGGSCRQFEAKGGSLITLWPTSSKPHMSWACVCRPAVVKLPASRDALDVELCQAGAPCARVAWPARTPMPVATPAPREGAEHPLIINVTPAVPAQELSRMVSMTAAGEVPWSQLSWGDGEVTVPARWAHEPGLTLKLRRYEKLEPTTCEGLSFCDVRDAHEIVSVRINP